MMRKILLITLFLVNFSLKSHAQEGQIILDDKKFVYQNIIEYDNTTVEELNLMIKSIGFASSSIDLIADTPNKLVYQVAGIPSKTGELEGYPYMSTPFIISEYATYSGLLTYDIKDSKIRITFTNVSYYIHGNTIFNAATPIDGIIFKKNGEVKKAYKEKTFKAFVYTFDSNFVPQNEVNDKW